MSISAKEVVQSSERLKSQIVRDRRTIHQNPEVGVYLPNTKAYVKKRLTEMGYSPKEICESGIVATITGKDTDRCILLRADMDALKVSEMTNLEFKSTNSNMHACGHDMHTAMLLGCANLLRKYQNEIEGTVKLVFQPDEEGFTGAKSMLKSGVLKNPVPQAGLALHINSGTPSGLVLVGNKTPMAGCTLFRITVDGVGCHGAMPETGIDPINVATHIYLAIQTIVTREVSAKQPAVITVGKFIGGQAPNIIPQSVTIEGTIRTFDRALSDKAFHRIGEISKYVAQAFGSTATVEEISSAPPLINNPELTKLMAVFTEELFGKSSVYRMSEGGMGSEDFASYTYELPCTYLLIGAGTKEESPLYGEPMHNEKVVFNEDILTKGSAIYTYCAMKWLEYINNT